MSTAPENGRNNRPKHVELIEIIKKIIIVASSLLSILLYQWCKVTQTSNFFFSNLTPQAQSHLYHKSSYKISEAKPHISLLAVIMNVTSHIHRFLLCYSPLLKDIKVTNAYYFRTFRYTKFQAPTMKYIGPTQVTLSCSWQQSLKTLWTAVASNGIIGTSKHNRLYIPFICWQRYVSATVGHLQVTKNLWGGKLNSVWSLVVVHIINFQRDLVESLEYAPKLSILD